MSGQELSEIQVVYAQGGRSARRGRGAGMSHILRSMAANEGVEVPVAQENNEHHQDLLRVPPNAHVVRFDELLAQARAREEAARAAERGAQQQENPPSDAPERETPAADVPPRVDHEELVAGTAKCMFDATFQEGSWVLECYLPGGHSCATTKDRTFKGFKKAKDSLQKVHMSNIGAHLKTHHSGKLAADFWRSTMST